MSTLSLSHTLVGINQQALAQNSSSLSTLDPRFMDILNTLVTTAALTQQQLAISAMQNPVHVS